MDHEFSQADLAAVFRKVGASPIDKGIEELVKLMRPAAPAEGHGVVYRTILSNGTAPPPKVKLDAQLEFGSN